MAFGHTIKNCSSRPYRSNDSPTWNILKILIFKFCGFWGFRRSVAALNFILIRKIVFMDFITHAKWVLIHRNKSQHCILYNNSNISIFATTSFFFTLLHLLPFEKGGFKKKIYLKLFSWTIAFQRYPTRHILKKFNFWVFWVFGFFGVNFFLKC